MTTQIRILLALAAVALLAGWLGLHRRNMALQARLAGEAVEAIR